MRILTFLLAALFINLSYFIPGPLHKWAKRLKLERKSGLKARKHNALLREIRQYERSTHNES